mgnify:CR=1 FL=1
MRNRSLAAVMLLVVFASTAPAQEFEPPAENAEWIELLQGAEPGTPAKIEITEGGPEQTAVLVEIPGFWTVPRIGDDQREYTELVFPGLGSLNDPGAPQLPAVKFRLAVPSLESTARLVALEGDDEIQLELGTVWPQPVPERDFQEPPFDLEDEDGAPEQFLIDEEIYESQGLWPFVRAEEQIRPVASGPVPFVECSIAPCQFEPASGVLQIQPRFQVVYEHQGFPQIEGPLVLEDVLRFEREFLNWELVREIWQINTISFEADYLFVYPAEMRDTLVPLINQKRRRSYAVSELQLENIGTTCSEIRSAIQSWHTGRPANRPKYALLVGDTDLIPFCDSPAGVYVNDVPTDDLYGSVNGDDLNEEILVGRLSIDDEEDLGVQVQKLLTYMDTPLNLGQFRRVGLVAHKENAPGKYEGAHESVRTASYNVTPDFVTFYGSDASVEDADVRNFIDERVGLVAYRGHGNSTAWTGWSDGNDYFNTTDVGLLANTPYTPVIWSFACTNANLDFSDSIAERWMETEDGAVSHYGASIPSYTTANHELDRAMFRSVYRYNLTKQGRAIQIAEWEMEIIEWGDNAWMYNLLGDPDMDIRRDNPLPWTFIYPEIIDPLECPSCPVEFQVVNELGDPVENVIVSIYQALGDGQRRADDVQDNRYTDVAGRALVPADGLAEGELSVVFRSLDGEVFETTIPVESDAVSAPSGSTVALRLNAVPSVTSASTSIRFGAPVPTDQVVEVFDVRGRAVVDLTVPAGMTSVAWDGRDARGAAVGSGIYHARMVVGGRALSTRVTIIR